MSQYHALTQSVSIHSEAVPRSRKQCQMMGETSPFDISRCPFTQPDFVTPCLCAVRRSSNSLRVIKTTKQTSAEAVTYPQVVRNIIAKDGLVNGLLIRGLGTKILANGLQGMMFTVLWRLGQDWWAKKEQP